MIKKLLIILLIFTTNHLSQVLDSLKIDTTTSATDSLQTEVTDSTTLIDSLKTTQPPDTLSPIYGAPLSGVSTIINRNTFLFTNYRYSGDFIRSFQFNFTKDLGFTGQPHETFIYGIGDNGISYLRDGVLWNNRYTNSLDLNFIQSEDVDSIEIIPSPRGFLYGPYNNPVALNFIMKDFISPEPYTRLKYYEGPDGEAMIDGKFNALIAKRWNFSFQATNRIVDSTYRNSEFSIWQANAKLKYFLSNSINLTGWYYFVKSDQGLNGGVDFDSLSQISSDPDSDLYEPLSAPVLYPSRTLEVTQHSFGLRLQIKSFENGHGELNFYQKYLLDELRNQRDSIKISEDLKDNVSGIAIKYRQRFDLFSFNVFSNYESNRVDKDIENTYNGIPVFEDRILKDYEIFSLGGITALHLLNDALEFSVFYKFNNISVVDFSSNRTGGGVDVKYNLINLLHFYLGISSYTNYENNSANAFEVGGKIILNNLLVDLKYSRSHFNLLRLRRFFGPRTSGVVQLEEISALGLILRYKLWLILLEANTAYYIKSEDRELSDLPELQFNGGIYLNDFFFDGNLNLKAGFKFYYTGKINSAENHLHNKIEVDPSNKIDFTLIGKIGEVAIFYFIWENLFDNTYFITPYYPMPRRNIRFGLAWELFN